jgi:hypothetical protein
MTWRTTSSVREASSRESARASDGGIIDTLSRVTAMAPVRGHLPAGAALEPLGCLLFGGTALLIVVGVAIDTVGQIEAHLVSRQYEGFVKGTRIRGRLGR